MIDYLKAVFHFNRIVTKRSVFYGLVSTQAELMTWTQYKRKNLTTCSKSANKPSTNCVRTACYKLSTSLEQAVNNLQQPC